MQSSTQFSSKSSAQFSSIRNWQVKVQQNEFCSRLQFRIKQLKDIKTQAKPQQVLPNEEDLSLLKLPVLAHGKSHPEKPPIHPFKNSEDIKQIAIDKFDHEMKDIARMQLIQNSSYSLEHNHSNLQDYYKIDNGKTNKMVPAGKYHSTTALEPVQQRIQRLPSALNERDVFGRKQNESTLSSIQLGPLLLPPKISNRRNKQEVNEDLEVNSQSSQNSRSRSTTNHSSRKLSNASNKNQTKIDENPFQISQQENESIPEFLLDTMEGQDGPQSQPYEKRSDELKEEKKTIEPKISETNISQQILQIDKSKVKKISSNLRQSENLKLMKANEKEAIRKMKIAQFRQKHSQTSLSFSDATSLHQKLDEDKEIRGSKVIQASYIMGTTDLKSKIEISQSQDMIPQSILPISEQPKSTEQKMKTIDNFSDYCQKLELSSVSRQEPQVQQFNEVEPMNEESVIHKLVSTAIKLKTKSNNQDNKKKKLKQVQLPISRLSDQLKSKILSNLNRMPSQQTPFKSIEKKESNSHFKLSLQRKETEGIESPFNASEI